MSCLFHNKNFFKNLSNSSGSLGLLKWPSKKALTLRNGVKETECNGKTPLPNTNTTFSGRKCLHQPNWPTLSSKCLYFSYSLWWFQPQLSIDAYMPNGQWMLVSLAAISSGKVRFPSIGFSCSHRSFTNLLLSGAN